MKFGTDIQGPQRMNSNDFDDPLFLYCHQYSVKYCISTSIAWIGTKFCTKIHGSQVTNPNASGDPLTFLLALPQT